MFLQGIVDADYCFLDVCIGWPGSVHDTRVFVHSPIYILITEKDLFPNKPVSINGVNVPLFLTGDSVYPLQTWLMKPFPQYLLFSATQPPVVVNSLEEVVGDTTGDIYMFIQYSVRTSVHSILYFMHKICSQLAWALPVNHLGIL